MKFCDPVVFGEPSIVDYIMLCGLPVYIAILGLILLALIGTILLKD